MEPRTVLIVRTSALGDVVHVLPSLEALRQLYPRARISWLVEPSGAQLLEHQPQIERLYVFDRPRWKRSWRKPLSWPALLRELLRLVREIRSQRFDLVVDFQCNVRSGLAVLLSGGSRRLGFSPRDCPEWGGYLFTSEKAPPCPRGVHKVEKNLHLVRTLGWQGGLPAASLEVPGPLRDWAREVRESLPGSGPVVAVHPAVSRFGEIKRWPAARFQALVDLARESLGARALITWGPGERPQAEALARPTIAPPTETALHLAALIQTCDALVAADTGALHIASALGVPTVGIYGPKDERIYGPHPPAERSRVVRSRVPCSPCTLRRCEHRICMSMVFPEDVVKALREALAAGAGQRQG